MRNLNIFYKHTSVTLVIIAIIVFLFVSLSLQLFTNAYSPEYIPSDTYTYIRAAKSFFNELKPDHTRSMGFSMLSGLPYLVYSKPSLSLIITWNYIFNFILWIITILTLYAALKLHLNKKTSLILAIVFILCVGNIAQVSVLLTETMSCCLLTLIGYQLLLFYKNKRDLNLAYSVALMNFSVLVRPGMIYLAFIFNTIFIIYFFRNKIFPSLKTLLPVICTILLIMYQTIAMYKTFGNFTVSYVDKYGWYLYLGAESNAEANNFNFLEERNARRSILYPLPPKFRYELATVDFKRQLTNNPKLIFNNFVSNIVDNIIVGNIRIAVANDYHNFAYFNYVRYYFYLISKAQNIMFNIMGLFLILILLFRPKFMSLSLIMSFAIIYYIVLTSGISFWEGDRFNLVIYPIILMTLSYFLEGNKLFEKEIKL